MKRAAVMATVMDALEDIRAVNEKGIRTLMTANRWGGAAFHNAGWNPAAYRRRRSLPFLRAGILHRE